MIIKTPGLNNIYLTQAHIKKNILSPLPTTGFEPVRLTTQILSLPRIPIPPSGKKRVFHFFNILYVFNSAIVK